MNSKIIALFILVCFGNTNFSTAQLMQISFKEKTYYFQDKALTTAYKKKIKSGDMVELLTYKRKERGNFLLEVKELKTGKKGFLLKSAYAIVQSKEFLEFADKRAFNNVKKVRTINAATVYLSNQRKNSDKWNIAKKMLIEIEYEVASKKGDIDKIKKIIKNNDRYLSNDRKKTMELEVCVTVLDLFTDLNPYVQKESSYYFYKCIAKNELKNEIERACNAEGIFLLNDKTATEKNFYTYLNNCKNNTLYPQVKKEADIYRMVKDKMRRAKTDDPDFKAAKTKNTDYVYLYYLQKHPDGKHIELAMKSIKNGKIIQLKKALFISMKKLKGIVSPDISVDALGPFIIGFSLKSGRTAQTIGSDNALVAKGYIYFKDNQYIDFRNTKFPETDVKSMWIIGRGKASLSGLTLLPGTFILR